MLPLVAPSPPPTASRALFRGLAAGLIVAALTSAPMARAADPVKDLPIDTPPAGIVETPTGPDSTIGDTKERLSDEDLADKREGFYVTGLPIANYDPNTGFGAGATAFLFDNGKPSDKFFAYTPYRQRAYAVVFFTTLGLQFHTLDYDAPYIGGTKFRVRSALTYERNISANYFGTGTETLDNLSFTGAGTSYGSASDYTDALERLRPDGTAYSKYNKYLAERPSFGISLERDFFGGLIRPLVGVNISHMNIRDYSSTSVEAFDPQTGSKVGATQARTKLGENCAAGRVLGCNGGWDTTYKLGIAFDTRDYEPDPNHGWFVDLTGEFATKYTGADFNYFRLTFAPKFYYSPFPKLADVVLAMRGILSAQVGDVPFFSMNSLSFTQRNADGLGGLRTLRGYRQDRFVGKLATVLNVEIRWTFAHFRLWKERFALIGSPFLDMGRVYDRAGQLSLDRWKRTQGAALRIAWNQATVLGVDYGINEEDSGLYVDFNYIF